LSDVLFILQRLNWNSILDILLVALVFYWILILIQGTQAVQLLRGVLVLVFITFLIINLFDLTAFRWLINKSLPALLVAIPVIFQPELRRALERLGRTGTMFARAGQYDELEETLQVVAFVAQQLAAKHLGALIALERETGLEEYIETGIRLDAQISRELLLTIFHTNTALHDGAVIIRNNRIVSASCLLPLSRLGTGNYHLGTRHRAALGLTETTDAIVVIVSEETGIVSISYDGRLIRELDEIRLLKLLWAFFRNRFINTSTGWSIFKKRFENWREQTFRK
jgi:diadenylate cyclase